MSFDLTRCLGDPPEWLDILNQTGILDIIGQSLTVWQHKPLLTSVKIQQKKFNTASELLVAVVAEKRITWNSFRSELFSYWQNVEALDKRLAAVGSLWNSYVSGNNTKFDKEAAIAKLLWKYMIVINQVAPGLLPPAHQIPTLPQFLPWIKANLNQGNTLRRIGEALLQSVHGPSAEFRSDEAVALFEELRYVDIILLSGRRSMPQHLVSMALYLRSSLGETFLPTLCLLVSALKVSKSVPCFGTTRLYYVGPLRVVVLRPGI
jgi:hypothetical protein